MSDAMSIAAFADLTAELLPPRTVLSMMATTTVNNPAPVGQISNPTGGEQGQMYDTWLYAWRQVLGLPHGSSAPYDNAS